MATTTQILFNSPALHSLKRDQLVKLCKTHSIKANGKTVDLISRLKEHAQTLPKESPLSIAARSEEMNVDDADDLGDTDTSSRALNFPRPSEQWEIMDTINETEESSSQGSLATRNGEFGTGNSRSTTVSSSIRALATSLGLKRSISKSGSTTSVIPPLPMPQPDELEQFSTPYSSLPAADPSSVQTDHFTFDPTPTLLKKFDFGNIEDTAPLPGHTLRPGVQAPTNARLSLGLNPPTPNKQRKGPTTTLRLVSDPSKPPTASHKLPDGPATPKLKPFATSFDLILGSPSVATPAWHADTNYNRLYPDLSKQAGMTPLANLNPPSPSPLPSTHDDNNMFLFGSPNPKHRVSDVQFRSAATSVLEEMNRRLNDEGVEGIESGIIDNLRPGGSMLASPGREIKPLPKAVGGHAVKAKFDKAHDQQFNKMESIGGYLNRKAAPATRVQAEESRVRLGTKRKSSVLGDNSEKPIRSTVAGARKSATGTRVISNGRRKAAKIPGAFGDDDDDSDEEDAPSGKRARMDGAASPSQEDTTETDKEAERLAKEREAIRRKLDANKARRRSSVAHGGRVSTGGNRRVSRGPVPAKSKLNDAKPSRFGFFSSAAKSIVKNVWGMGKAAPAKASAPQTTVKAAAPQVQQKNSMGPPPVVRPSTLVKPAPSVKALSETTRSKTSTITSTTSARSRSPIPPFNAGTQSSVRTNTTRSSVTNRNPVGSMGTRTSSLASSRVSSLGTKSSLQAPASKRMSSTSSRLLAPTASSLAKTVGSVSRRNSALGDTSVAIPLNTIPNGMESVPEARPSATPFSPQGKIFSKPLIVPLGSGIPSPVRTAATAMGASDDTNGPPLQRAPSGVTRQRTLTKKPRISRSKVIAKLASHRAAAAAASGSSSSLAPAPAGRIRSSLGATAHRRSMAGAGGRKSIAGEGAILMSAKKRARQSEYVRRQSRKSKIGANSGSGMDDNMVID